MQARPDPGVYGHVSRLSILGVIQQKVGVSALGFDDLTQPHPAVERDLDCRPG
ncbi:hypothetical protein ACMHYO_15990 [Allopusillimonas ginsengisoli]|uniref:hypothetical protein n=1 Tax=Allopusillimonas ginsengisoli TaxID=453575 RepID=UPI0039C49748